MALQSNTTPQLYHHYQCVQPSTPVPDHGPNVHLLSNVVKPLADMQPGEQGVMKPASGGMSDAERCYQFQRLVDCGVLREGFAYWYREIEGRKIEKELVGEYNRMTAKTPEHEYTAARFRDIVRKAIKLLEDDDDDTVYKTCLEVLNKNKHHLDALSFLELQEAICSVNDSLHHCPSSSDFLAAAARQLKNHGFTDRVAAKLPIKAQELPTACEKVAGGQH